MSMFGQPKNAGPKPVASLSSTLLARKGQASPAMRRQGYGGFGAVGGNDDLGWNDMGEPAPMLAPVPPVPPVLLQREELEQEFAAAPIEPEPVPLPALVTSLPPTPPVDAPRPEFRPVSVATAARMGRETAKKRGKAAFTLRLDQDRHLRLRLASALQGASAQTLVTEALDALLQSLPEVDALVAQLPPRTKR